MKTSMLDHTSQSAELRQQEELRKAYEAEMPYANRLLRALREQFEILIEDNGISLAVPIEYRVKDLSSIQAKISRKQIEYDLKNITDLCGIRLITLFQRDVELLGNLIKKNLVVLDSEDAANRLGDSVFGYRSNHYIVKMPDSWLQLPSNKGLDDKVVEIQVRTLAQHMWAAASHKLQYKREASVPPHLLRSISRVSAILELVDLEYSRILDDRNDYISEKSIHSQEDDLLDVDVLASTLAEVLPEKNKDEYEDYDSLLGQIQGSGIFTVGELKRKLRNGYDEAMRAEEFALLHFATEPEDQERKAKGVYYTHVGLARAALFNPKE